MYHFCCSNKINQYQLSYIIFHTSNKWFREANIWLTQKKRHAKNCHDTLNTLKGLDRHPLTYHSYFTPWLYSSDILMSLTGMIFAMETNIELPYHIFRVVWVSKTSPLQENNIISYPYTDWWNKLLLTCSIVAQTKKDSLFSKNNPVSHHQKKIMGQSHRKPHCKVN